MANHEDRPEYGGSFATARAGADYPSAAQKSGISRKSWDALVRGVRSSLGCCDDPTLIGHRDGPAVRLGCC
jgi:hypothetical protein